MALPYTTAVKLTPDPLDLTTALTMVDTKRYQVQVQGGHDVYIAERPEDDVVAAPVAAFALYDGQTIEVLQLDGLKFWAWSPNGIASTLVMAEKTA